MEPTSRKLIRAFFYTVAMGVVTLVVVVESQNDGYINLLMGVAYILGALLVFGVDIKRIKVGPLEIVFESDFGNTRLDDYEE